MAEEDKTIRMVTNLDRKAIEAKLAGVREAAQKAGLAEVAGMLDGIEGQPRAYIEGRVTHALHWLAEKPQHERIVAELELVEINLKNLLK
jgi:hypothetical protein